MGGETIFAIPLIHRSLAFDLQFISTEIPLTRVEIKVSAAIETTNPPRAGFNFAADISLAIVIRISVG